jgi:hypothetical protein
VPGPPEFADGLHDRIGLAGAARVPIAMGDGRAGAEPELPRRVCWQLIAMIRWRRSSIEIGAPSVARSRGR